MGEGGKDCTEGRQNKAANGRRGGTAARPQGGEREIYKETVSTIQYGKLRQENKNRIISWLPCSSTVSSSQWSVTGSAFSNLLIYLH
jgi:hypothetical protein